MKQELDFDAIARGIGARRVGKVRSSGGYFGALQLMAEVNERFRVPAGGGRATNPEWTERRLIPLSPQTLDRLEELAVLLHAAPLQIAAVLLEKTVGQIDVEEVATLTRTAGTRR